MFLSNNMAPLITQKHKSSMYIPFLFQYPLSWYVDSFLYPLYFTTPKCSLPFHKLTLHPPALFPPVQSIFILLWGVVSKESLYYYSALFWNASILYKIIFLFKPELFASTCQIIICISHFPTRILSDFFFNRTFWEMTRISNNNTLFLN